MSAWGVALSPAATRVRALALVARAVRDLGQVSTGILYAHLRPRVDLDAFAEATETLRRAGFVSETAHRLCWIGPTHDRGVAVPGGTSEKPREKAMISESRLRIDCEVGS